MLQGWERCYGDTGLGHSSVQNGFGETPQSSWILQVTGIMKEVQRDTTPVTSPPLKWKTISEEKVRRCQECKYAWILTFLFWHCQWVRLGKLGSSSKLYHEGGDEDKIDLTEFSSNFSLNQLWCRKIQQISSNIIYQSPRLNLQRKPLKWSRWIRWLPEDPGVTTLLCYRTDKRKSRILTPSAGIHC